MNIRSAFAACLPVLLIVLLTGATANAANVGFAMRSVPDGHNPPLDVGIWYPTQAAPHSTPVGLFVQNVAPDAPLLGHDLPLVVFSHGTGGEFAGHNDTAFALAEAGFVVAAPTHAGDNYHDQSKVTDIGGRVRQLSAVIDYMQSSWLPSAIDPARIGAFGFSAGGLTVLIAAGAEPNLARIGPHCADHPTYFDCVLVKAHHVTPPTEAAPQAKLPHDRRLRAIVVAAPALGFTMDRSSLSTVTIPVQLWRADNDAILPAPFYADAVAAALPNKPDFHPVPNAGHFDFLAPCPPALAHIAPPICTSAPSFDRARFHQTFNQAIVAFFRSRIGPK